MRRWVVPSMRGVRLAALALGVVGAGLVAARWSSGDWRRWLPDLLVGWAFLVSGALMARRPGGTREGCLVVGVGAAWFLADVVPELALLHRAVLVHAAVAMPRGRLSTRLGWGVVGAGYASVALPSLAASPLVPLVLGVGLLAVARESAGPRRGSCLVVGAVLLLYEAGLVGVALAVNVVFVRGLSRSDVTDLVVEMGPQDALADLARRDPSVRTDPALRAALEDRLRHGPLGRLDRVAAELADQGSEVAEAGDRLSAARRLVSEARADLTRIARGLYPSAIADGSLESALESIAGTSPIPVDLDLRATRVGPAAAAVVYFVCSEAVANAARHSGANRVTICVERRNERGSSPEVVVEVRDDGVGGAALDRGSGLAGLADRVGIAGGVLTVDSGPSGTRISARVPDDRGGLTAKG